MLPPLPSCKIAELAAPVGREGGADLAHRRRHPPLARSDLRLHAVIAAAKALTTAMVFL